MRTTLSLKIPKRSVTPLIAVLLLTGTVSLGTACDDDKDYSRREHIEWSNSPEFEEALTGTLHIPVRASKEQDATPFKRSIYIRSNVAYQVGFEGEKEESGELPAEEWLNVDEIKRGVRPGINELVLLITPHTESYVERKGCISLHTDVEFLNEFIAVVQGFPKYTKDYEGNHYLMNKEELENKIATLTGGRAAEEVVFHSITTGASNDIEQATKLARAMLTRYGMSDEFDMVALETVNNQYLGGDTSLACSAQTQCEIDQKVVELVKAQHAKAVQILTDNRAKLDELAQYLYQKETITGDEFMEILNREG